MNPRGRGSFTEIGPAAGLERALEAALARERCNAFGLRVPASGSAQGELEGYAVIPAASLFNHSCEPRASPAQLTDGCLDAHGQETRDET